jgi:hypothetical protein
MKGLLDDIVVVRMFNNAKNNNKGFAVAGRTG